MKKHRAMIPTTVITAKTSSMESGCFLMTD
jgi:hypothetical protein